MRKTNPLVAEIKQIVKANGGTAKLALEIMLENPNWFSMQEIIAMKERIRNREKDQRWRAKHPKPNEFYSEADTQYILSHYGIMKTSLLADILGRTTVAVRDHFYQRATEHQKDWVRLHGRYSGRTDNFKKK